MVTGECAKGMVECVERLQRRTAQDLKSLYLDDVYRYVSVFVRPQAEAEDVTMIVFHAAFVSISRLRRRDDPKLWLLGIARRKVADSLRRRYRRRETTLSFHVEYGERDLDQEMIVCQVLAQIPADHSQILVLKYVNGLSVEEIAKLLGRSAAACNSLLQRARESFMPKGRRTSFIRRIKNEAIFGTGDRESVRTATRAHRRP